MHAPGIAQIRRVPPDPSTAVCRRVVDEECPRPVCVGIDAHDLVVAKAARVAEQVPGDLVSAHARHASGDVDRRELVAAGAADVDLTVAQGVVAAATEQPVEPRRAVEGIVAAVALQLVGAVTTVEVVVATAPQQHVVATQAAQHVVTRTAYQAVRPGGADYHLRPRTAHRRRLHQRVAAVRALPGAGLGDRLIAHTACLLRCATDRHEHTCDGRQHDDGHQPADSERSHLHRRSLRAGRHPGAPSEAYSSIHRPSTLRQQRRTGLSRSIRDLAGISASTRHADRTGVEPAR